NLDFLKREIQEKEERKAPLKDQSKTFAETIFSLQEMGKPKNEPEDEDDEGHYEFTEFKKGGTIPANVQRVVRSLSKKYGITEEGGMRILNEGGYIEDSMKRSKFLKDTYGKQKTTPFGFGDVNALSIEQRLEDIEYLHPDLFQEHLA